MYYMPSYNVILIPQAREKNLWSSLDWSQRNWIRDVSLRSTWQRHL